MQQIIMFMCSFHDTWTTVSFPETMMEHLVYNSFVFGLIHQTHKNTQKESFYCDSVKTGNVLCD